MDSEFHYYLTYLIAARAGLPPPDALTVAWASQYTDDNTLICTVDKGLPTEYTNYISQTADILKPRRTLMRIYSLFHFIPGDPQAPTAWRKDGAMHWLNTTPDSENANLILDAALATGDRYRIGIACHAYADTWAHQNFVGYGHEFNACIGALFTAVMPNIGHADALCRPDEATRRWRDPRLIHEPIDNGARFLAAAVALYGKLARFVAPDLPAEELNRRAASLRDDLTAAGLRPLKLAFGSDAELTEGDAGSKLKARTPDAAPAPALSGEDAGDPDTSAAARAHERRLTRYQRLAVSPTYGGAAIPPYDPDRWMDEAINEQVRGLRDRSDFILSCLDPWPDTYTWKDRAAYHRTPWHRFQEAVKAHQNVAWAILEHRNFLGLDLADL